MTMTAIGREAWRDLGGATDRLDLVEPMEPPMGLRSSLDVNGLLGDSVALASLALQEYDERRNRRNMRSRVVRSGDRIRTSAQSEQHLTIDGQAPTVWAPLSGFWQAADGWVRTHANYPHHAEQLARLLGTATNASRSEFASAVSERGAVALEADAARSGAIVGAVRDRSTWAAHEQARAVAEAPLIRLSRVAEVAPVRSVPGPMLSGVRVLDLTRVLAGPVATRNLALAGAEVLRIDPPHPPEIDWQHVETGSGKRTAILNLATPGDRRIFLDLLGQADVVVTGYRPGALEAFGLATEDLQARRPGVVHARVSAWGWQGPWASRRGFDSIVQAVSGIALAESLDGTTPRALPAQALDHSAGHLLTGGIARALTRRSHEGGGWQVDVVLARLAQALLKTRVPSDGGDATDDLTTETVQEASTPAGVVRLAAPPLTLIGAPSAYPALAAPWGSDPPHWV